LPVRSIASGTTANRPGVDDGGAAQPSRGAATDGLAAGNAAAGRQKALVCQTCHGLDGKAKIPEAPNLAGQSEVYLVKALNDYRSGARKNDMMSLVAPTLKDNDIEDLAAYYSAIEVTVGPPPK
jgi:cytochrome c553